MHMPSNERVSILVRALGMVAPASYVVLSCLLCYANRGGYCHPSLRTIAKRTDLAVNTVREGLDDLDRHGILLVMRKKRCINHYQVQPLRKWKITSVSIPDTAAPPNLYQSVGQISVSNSDTAPKNIYRETVSNSAHEYKGDPQGVSEAASPQMNGNHLPPEPFDDRKLAF